MLKIAHRINDIATLRKTPTHLGIEMDIHAYGDKLTVHHDAFAQGADFDEWLASYNHRLLILNIKEEGIEKRVLEKVQQRGIRDFFLLDVTPPMMFKLARSGESRMAIRMSACESASNALSMTGKVEWVFIDAMEDNIALPITRAEYEALKVAKFKLCMVSHELWGRDESHIAAMQKALQDSSIKLDAILTKRPDLWPDTQGA